MIPVILEEKHISGSNSYYRNYFTLFYTEKTSPNYFLEEFNFNFKYVRLCDNLFLDKLFANSGELDKVPPSVSDLGLHC